MTVHNVHVTWGYDRLATGPCSINLLLKLTEYKKVKSDHPSYGKESLYP